jgi:hypothetical protein
MDLFTKLVNAIPELTVDDFHPVTGTISLKDDGDGIQYITKWDYAQSLPKGMKIGK